jgi:hypothetical protein
MRGAPFLTLTGSTCWPGLLQKVGSRRLRKPTLVRAIWGIEWDMRQSLRLHPNSRCFAVSHIDVEIARPRTDVLRLTYIVSGEITNLRIPALRAASRGEALWRHTCFEAFIGVTSSADYYEFNFAPSRQWAAYRFSGYRTGMCAADDVSVPSIDVGSTSDGCTLEATLDLHRLAPLPSQASRRIGLSAVIEDLKGDISYWALMHPPGKPDFHHPKCFAYEFPAVAQP